MDGSARNVQLEHRRTSADGSHVASYWLHADDAAAKPPRARSSSSSSSSSGSSGGGGGSEPVEPNLFLSATEERLEQDTFAVFGVNDEETADFNFLLSHRNRLLPFYNSVLYVYLLAASTYRVYLPRLLTARSLARSP